MCVCVCTTQCSTQSRYLLGRLCVHACVCVCVCVCLYVHTQALVLYSPGLAAQSCFVLLFGHSVGVGSDAGAPVCFVSAAVAPAGAWSCCMIACRRQTLPMQITNLLTCLIVLYQSIHFLCKENPLMRGGPLLLLLLLSVNSALGSGMPGIFRAARLHQSSHCFLPFISAQVLQVTHMTR